MQLELFQSDLQRKLTANLRRLLPKERMAPEYRHRWKMTPMKTGNSIPALKARQRKTSDSDCSGWPTPEANSDRGHNHRAHGTPSLGEAAQLAGWPTPTDSMVTEQDLVQALTAGNGKERKDYAESHLLAGWTTPQANEPESQERPSREETGRTTEYLGRQVQGLVPSGCSTPTARDHKDTSHRDRAKGEQLDGQAQLAGWATPTTESHPNKTHKDRRDGGQPNLNMMAEWISGADTASSDAGTAKPVGYRLVLNPFFSSYLMGFPPSWGIAGIRSYLKSKRSR